MTDRHPLLDLPALDAPTAVLDFETTGLSSAGGDRVCEVAVVRGKPRGGRRKKFSRLVDPEMPMPDLAQSIHGISDQELRGQPRFADVLPGLAKVLDGAVIVAHSASFDVGFLRAECHRAGVPVPELGPVVCTLDLSRSLYGFSKCSLEALARRTNTPQNTAHRALADTVTTMRVYKELLLGLGGAAEAPPTVGDLLDRVQLLQRDGVGRLLLAGQLRKAADSEATLTIDYTNRYGDGPLTTRRQVTVRELRLPYFDAWCHHQCELRTFHLRRVQQIVA